MRAARIEPKELARTTGIALSTLYAYIKGTRSPSDERVASLAKGVRADAETRARLYAAAGIEVQSDLPVVAADLVRSLPRRDQYLAVELLRVQARLARSKREEHRHGAPIDAAPVEPSAEERAAYLAGLEREATEHVAAATPLRPGRKRR
jgi:transcriptional regulator with XRE-family HTH domain